MERAQHPTWDRLTGGYDVVIEAPATVAAALTAAATQGHDDAGEQLTQLLEDAEQAAIAQMAAVVRVVDATRHVEAHGHPGVLAPHLHITPDPTVRAIRYYSAAIAADEAYQRTLIAGLSGVGMNVVVVPESAHGWQLEAWMTQAITDPARCDLQPRALWPLDLPRPWLRQQLQQTA